MEKAIPEKSSPFAMEPVGRLIVKFAVMILGAFDLATMWEAVFADVGVAFIAILNATRCLKTEEFRS